MLRDNGTNGGGRTSRNVLGEPLAICSMRKGKNENTLRTRRPPRARVRFKKMVNAPVAITC